MPTAPTLTNSTRQPKPSMIQNSSGAKQASPRYSPTVYTAVAFARSCCGNRGADHPAVDRKARRFANAEPEAAQQQSLQPHRHAVEQGKQRPQGQ